MISIFASATRDGAVTPSNTTVLKYKCIYVGTGGTVVISRNGGATTTSYLVPDGGSVFAAGDRVMAASTATNLIWQDWD